MKVYHPAIVLESISLLLFQERLRNENVKKSEEGRDDEEEEGEEEGDKLFVRNADRNVLLSSS